MVNMVTSKELFVNVLLSEIKYYHLSVPEYFETLTLDYIVENYNGTGPDWLPAKKRKILDWTLDVFAPAVLIHDMEFSASNKTRAGFNRANKRLFKNCIKIINVLFPVYNPFDWIKRMIWYGKAYLVYRACCRFGFSAWLD